MPSTYTTNTGIEKPGSGEQSGTWGTTVNTNMDILDRALNGVVSIALSGTSSTLTTTDGLLSDGMYKLLVLGGSPSGTHTITVAPADAQKIYFVRNTSGQSVVFTQGSGAATVTVLNGDSAIVYADGSDECHNLTDHLGMTSVNIDGGSIDGTPIGAASASTGNFSTLSVNGTAITATPAELNIMDGVTATTAELNIMDGVTATTAELNIMDGVTATTAELNYVDGVTSNIQTQLNSKAPTASPTFTGSVDAGDKIVLGSWEIWDSGGTLYFKYGTNNVFKIDSSGNITAEANVTAYGTV